MTEWEGLLPTLMGRFVISYITGSRLRKYRNPSPVGFSVFANVLKWADSGRLGTTRGYACHLSPVLSFFSYTFIVSYPEKTFCTLNESAPHAWI